MWLDADDVIPEREQQKIKKLKEQLTPDVSAVMMKYVTAFDDTGKPAFLFDRERLLKNGDGYLWGGRVHEAVAVRGKVLYSDAVIEHHSIKKEYSDRNLRIYERMIEEGKNWNRATSSITAVNFIITGGMRMRSESSKLFLGTGKRGPGSKIW